LDPKEVTGYVHCWKSLQLLSIESGNLPSGGPNLKHSKVKSGGKKRKKVYERKGKVY